MSTYPRHFCPANAAIVRGILRALLASAGLWLASCATPQHVLDIERGNALLSEGFNLLGRKDWAAAEQPLKAAISLFEGQSSNVDFQRIGAYTALARAQANTNQCDAAAYSLRSAINIQLMASEIYRDKDPNLRIQQARERMDVMPQCPLSTGESLRANAESFLRSKLPTLAAAERSRAEAEAESIQRRADEQAQMQALLRATQAAARQAAADRAGSSKASSEQCRCGPDYIPCLQRRSVAAGETCRISSSNGEDGISCRNASGPLGVRTWNRKTNRCEGIAK